MCLSTGYSNAWLGCRNQYSSSERVIDVEISLAMSSLGLIQISYLASVWMDPINIGTLAVKALM